MKNFLRSAFATGSIALLCACGAKGPLFMPEEGPPIEIAAPVESLDEEDDGPVAEPEAPAEPEEASTPPDDAG